MVTSRNNNENSKNTSFNSLLNVLLTKSVPFITVQELSQIQKDITILDTREPEEYRVSRIRGSEHLGYDNFEIANVDHITKDERIVVYCSVGYRSEKIGERLQNAGYSNVRNLYGGIFAWVNQEQPIVNNQSITNTIHPYGPFWSTFITNDAVINCYDTDE